jgi:hypothetical protein
MSIPVRVNGAKGMLTLRQNGLLLLKLDLTNMLPRHCPPYSPATARLSADVEPKLSTAICTELVLSPSILRLRSVRCFAQGPSSQSSRGMVGGDQGEKK